MYEGLIDRLNAHSDARQNHGGISAEASNALADMNEKYHSLETEKMKSDERGSYWQEEALRNRGRVSVIRHHNEQTKHSWFMDENGEIDEWRMESGFHNGPMCRRCGYSFCVNCNPDGYDDATCTVDWIQCGQCGMEISKGDKYCRYCGVKLIWDETELL